MQKHSNSRHRSSGGKFTSQPPRTAQDILRHARGDAITNCLHPPIEGQQPFGHFKQGLWYVASHGYTIRGNKRMSALAHHITYMDTYPHSLLGRSSNYKLKRLCSTLGCLNARHYTMVQKSSGKELGEQLAEEYHLMNTTELMAFYDKVLREDQILTFAEEEKADSFRMHLYRIRRQWKVKYPELYERYEYVMIQKDKLHPNMLNFTSRNRTYEDVLAQMRASSDALPTTSPPFPQGIASDEEIARAVALIERQSEPDPIEEYMRKEPAKEEEEPNYDFIYLKASLGQHLTKEEEEILNSGPPATYQGE